MRSSPPRTSGSTSTVASTCAGWHAPSGPTSRIYFHHQAKTLNPAEAALLAAIPEDPSAWDPVAHPRAAADHRALVLRLMLQQGYLTQSQFDKWNAAPMPNPKDVALPSTQ